MTSPSVPALLPAVFTPDASSHISLEIGRLDLENLTPVSSLVESKHPIPTSTVTRSEPMLNLPTSVSPAVEPSGLIDGADGNACDAINSFTADSSLGSVTEFTEQITRAREGLVPASRHAVALQPLPPRVAETKSETDNIWHRISLHVSQLQQLKIRDLDFTDLISVDDTSNTTPATCSVPLSTIPTPPPPPTAFMIPPPPPLGDSIAPPPPPLSLSTPTSSTTKTRKTMKLHWREAKPDVRSVFSSPTTENIWTQMSREIGPVKIDRNKLEHLFETRTVDMKSKVSNVCSVAMRQLYTNMQTGNYGLHAVCSPQSLLLRPANIVAQLRINFSFSGEVYLSIY